MRMKRKSITHVAAIPAISFCLLLAQCDNPTSEPSSGPSVLSIGGGEAVVGYIAPSFVARSVTNELVDLSRLRGKVVLIAFFGTSG